MMTQTVDGWNVYKDLEDYTRMGIDLKNSPFRLLDNKDGCICSTYPFRMICPKGMSDSDMENCSKFRTKERFPILSYFYPKSGASLWRSSQPRGGWLGGTTKYDRKMIQCIIETLPKKPLVVHKFTDPKREESLMHIIDARSKMAAIGNRIMGSGYENVNNYLYTWIYFCGIDNIHKVRESYLKLFQFCNESVFLSKSIALMDETKWFHYLAYILSAANLVAESIKGGRAVLVHCSDGWDRTAQLTSLAQILLDPYYRTIEGFEVLIEREFVAFGHMFSLRLGACQKNVFPEKEFCPVFIQYLDCVHQIFRQHPAQFQFNIHFLVEIAHHAFSLRFGTFLFNSEKERAGNNVKTTTLSLWTYLNSRKKEFINPYYRPSTDSATRIHADPLVFRLKLWEEYFLKWSPHHRDSIRYTISDSLDYIYQEAEKRNILVEKQKEELAIEFQYIEDVMKKCHFEANSV